jgi:hypothetical protein
MEKLNTEDGQLFIKVGSDPAPGYTVDRGVLTYILFPD